MKKIVCGLGNCGNNHINHLIQNHKLGIKSLLIDSDVKALSSSLSPNQIQVGEQQLNGAGTGGEQGVAEQVLEEERGRLLSALSDHFSGVDTVYIVAGMGGGVGTVLALFVADVARSLGFTSVSLLTLPFDFEGKRRKLRAEKWVEKIKAVSDRVVVQKNQDLLTQVNNHFSINQAFDKAHEMFVQEILS